MITSLQSMWGGGGDKPGNGIGNYLFDENISLTLQYRA